MPKTYYGYIRVSTVEQGNGASLDEQRAAITAFAARNDLTLTDWFMETSTAAKTGRREFTRMVASLRAGRAAGVIIHKIDRSARNLGDWARIGELVDQGIEVRFAHDDLDIRTRGGRLTADIQAVIAADFIRNNREEVKKGMYGWLKRGYFPFRAPLGYLDRGRHKLKEVDPVKGPLVADAFALYAGGTHSLESLRHALADKGLTLENGRPLNLNSLAKLLHNPFYIGLLRVKGQTFQGAHVPLVNPSVFNQVQDTLVRRVFPRPTHQVFPFRRLIRCDGCPRTLTGERRKGYAYYRCHTCPSVSFTGEAVEKAVKAMLSYAFDERDMRDIGDIVEALSQDTRVAEERRLALIDAELAKVADRILRLTDALIDGALDKAAFDERNARLLAQRVQLAERRGQGLADPFAASIVNRLGHWKTAKEGFEAASDAEKRDLLISLGSDFLAQGKELLFSAHFPIGEALKWRSLSVGAPNRGHVRIDNLDNRQPAPTPTADLTACVAALNTSEGREWLQQDEARRTSQADQA